MLAEKVTKVFYCKRWIVFKRLEPLIINSVCNVNRSITDNCQFAKNLLHLNYSTNVSSTRTYYLVPHRENSHAHEVMSNLTAYSNCVSPKIKVTEDLKIDSEDNLLEKSWISMSNSEILQNFKLLSYNAHLNSEDINHIKYQGIFDIILERLSVFSNEETIEFLNLLQLWNSHPLLNNNNLWRPLDKELTAKFPKLTTEQIFLISDCIYGLRMVTVSSFIFEALKRLKLQDLSPANLVQYAFLVKVKGRVHVVNLERFESCVEKNIDKFNMDELGIICMAFFKYETPIKRDTLILKILKKMLVEIENVSDITLSCILKILRYSADLNVLRLIDILLKVLENQVENRNLVTLTHMTIAQSHLLMDNKNLLQKIIERFEKEVAKARLKDIERFILSLYIFNCDPKTTAFYGIATQELLSVQRRGEISKYSKPYVYTIMFMLKANYFPEELVNKVMAPEFITKLCENDISKLEREYLDISYCLQIDHPEYRGPQLRKDQLRYLTKKFGVFQKKEGSMKGFKVDAAGRLIIDLVHQIKITLGSELAIHVDSPLPYINRQYIFLCYDPVSQSYVPPAEPLSQISLGEIKYAPKDGKQWIAIVPAWHNILTRNTYKPTGMLTMELRHLERIGYKTILVKCTVWNNLDGDKKQNYLMHILGEGLRKANDE